MGKKQKERTTGNSVTASKKITYDVYEMKGKAVLLREHKKTRQ